MKNRKIIAFLTAVIMSAGMLTACGGSGENAETEVSINVITDGSQVEVIEGSESGDAAGEATVTTAFVDPGAQFTGTDVDDGVSDSGDVTDAPAETTLPSNHEDIVEMIQQTGVATKAPVMKDYNVDYTTRYGYNQLNDAEKKLYGQILEAAKSVRLKVDVDDSVTDEMWVKVFGCMYLQEPQLFWLSGKKVSKGRLWYWEVDPEIIASMQKEIDTAVSKVLGEAEGKSDYDKLKIFHDYICLNNNFVKEDGFNQTIYGGFVKGTIQCEGYAKTMQYLCDLSGIEAMFIVGTNESGDSHAWNIVKVDGEWYNIDATWDDPILTEVDTTNVRHRYFLVPSEWIYEKSHFDINKKTTGTQVKYFDPPACTSDKLNYFNVTNQLYKDTASADAALKDAMKKAASEKKRAAEIRVADKSVYDAITAKLKDYASWIKSENSAVTSVASNCDPNTLVIELDLIY